MNGDAANRTRPPDTQERLLKERFADAVADQSRLMDSLAQTLLTVELAIPGLYATVLKWVSGGDQAALSCALVAAFFCWVAALVLTLIALFPKPYDVDPKHLRGSRDSIETFFRESARRKWVLLLASIAFFIAGLSAVLWDVLR